MRGLCLLVSACLLAAVPVGCVSPSHEGLPPGSPFQTSVVLEEDRLPQGMAVGDVTAHDAILWVRTEGPANVYVEWAPPSVWEKAALMGTVMAPVSRTEPLVTGAEADYTLSIPLAGLTPATRYRYRIMARPVGHSMDQQSAALVAKGEFSTAPDARTSVPITFAWSGDLGG
ncbi:MAG: hypothetical protein HP493_14010, partial [Nitrospira sp.]|nr:hypothetical protein [Nitrospira sp.]